MDTTYPRYRDGVLCILQPTKFFFLLPLLTNKYIYISFRIPTEYVFSLFHFWIKSKANNFFYLPGIIIAYISSLLV